LANYPLLLRIRFLLMLLRIWFLLMLLSLRIRFLLMLLRIWFLLMLLRIRFLLMLLRISACVLVPPMYVGTDCTPWTDPSTATFVRRTFASAAACVHASVDPAW
jgi:hypothetical protein